VPTTPAAQITCQKVTAFLADSFLELRSTDERKAAGIVPLRVTANDSLFMAGGDRALVQSFGIDSNTITTQLLAWEARANIYANYSRMLHVELPGAMMATAPTMPSDLTPKLWREFTREPEESFRRGTIANPLSADRYARTQPSDFHLTVTDMKRPDLAGHDFGAKLNELPRGDDD